VAADLLRAPASTEQLGEQGAELVVSVDPASMVTSSARGCPSMGIERLISATGRGIAA